MASDGNICGDSPRSPEEPPNADDDEFLDDRNEDELSCATSASLFRLRLYKRNVGYEFLDSTLSNFRTRAFERRALVLLPSAAVRPPGGPRRSPRAPRDRQRPLSVVRGRACREEQLFS